MSTPGCPSDEQLTAYLQGRISPAEAEALEAHVAVCPQCEIKIETDDDLRRIVADAFRQSSVAEDHLIAESEFRRAVEALEQLPGGPPADSTRDYQDSAPQIGQIIAGRYKLLEQIGEGGMGTVYMAQQTEPVKRLVALKVIIAGMDSRAVLARFEAERQALAIMDHPNIARVLDAGAMESGRPFFVMELVKGVPITRFCDQRRLTLRQRLELFVPVCQAIQHAHQKGIIHRDIKPSNVLVAMYDDRPVPKVIDFGLAKATGQSLTDKTLVTAFGAHPGTVLYMSPEQASLNNLDIDTRSDVFALGVLLYELLTGSTPLDLETVNRAAGLEVLRMVREEEPPRPSAKLSSSDALPSIAANRNIEPSRLTRLVQGELDWVALKALEKERARRYETANALARDVQRYLADEVVEARPPSAGYRLRKFVRRHKIQVIAASLVLLALLAGIIGTTFGLFRAEQQRQIAQQRGDAEARAKLDAEAKRVEAEKQQRRAEAEEKLASERLIQVEAEKKRAEEAKREAQTQQWIALLDEANGLRYSNRRGQRFRSIAAIQQALQLPVPRDRSRDELRNAAIAALCLPDLGDGPAWDPKTGPLEPAEPALKTGLRAKRLIDRLRAGTAATFDPRGPSISPDWRFILRSLEPYVSKNGRHMTVKIRVWRDEGKEFKPVLDDPDVYEEAIVFRNDSRQLALGHPDGTVSLYDLNATGPAKEVMKLKVGSRPFCLAYHPHLPILAVGTEETGLQLFDQNGKLMHKLLHPSSVVSISWRPDGKQLVCGCGDLQIYLWDAENGFMATKPWDGINQGGIHVAFNAAGDRVISNDWYGNVRLWDARNGRLVFHTPELQVYYSKEQPDIIGPFWRNDKLQSFRIAEGKELRQLYRMNPSGKEIINIACHPDGRLALTANSTGSSGLHVFDLTLGEDVAQIPFHSGFGCEFVRADTILTNRPLPGKEEALIERWPVEIHDKPARYEIGVPQPLITVPKGAGAFVSSTLKAVAVPQFNQGTLLLFPDDKKKQIRLPQHDVRFAMFSPNGRLIATMSHADDPAVNTRIKIWEVDTGRLIKELPTEKARWLGAFSPDGRWLVTSTAYFKDETNKQLLVRWNTETWNEVGTLPSTIGEVDFAHDLVLVPETDGSVILTQISTRKELARLTSPETGKVYGFMITNSGYLLGRGKESSDLFVWDLWLIRRQLAQMNLDWDGPPYFTDDQIRKARLPFTVQIDPRALGN